LRLRGGRGEQLFSVVRRKRPSRIVRSLNQSLALLPSELVQAYMKFDLKLMQVQRNEKRPVVPA